MITYIGSNAGMKKGHLYWRDGVGYFLIVSCPYEAEFDFLTLPETVVDVVFFQKQYWSSAIDIGKPQQVGYLGENNISTDLGRFTVLDYLYGTY